MRRRAGRALDHGFWRAWTKFAIDCFRPASPRIEKNPYSLACHVRGLSESAAREALAQARRLWTPISAGAGLELMEFDGGLEVRAAGREKGDAVETLWRESPPGTMAAYLGDDRTDEDAFRRLKGWGLGIRVSETPRPTLAEIWLPPPGGASPLSGDVGDGAGRLAGRTFRFRTGRTDRE
ncbi:MAG: hypothetical protein O2807_00455 [bacterium]|nr:hypothetical protein [bacterium]